MAIRFYRDLEAWQLGMQFVVLVYDLTKRFPREEIYGLTSQLRRAAISVPSNVAEGHQRSHSTYLHFVVIALGSLAEAETQIDLAERLQFVTNANTHTVRELGTRLRQVLHGLRRSLTTTAL